jgi:hypothetical protein
MSNLAILKVVKQVGRKNKVINIQEIEIRKEIIRERKKELLKKIIDMEINCKRSKMTGIFKDKELDKLKEELKILDEVDKITSFEK